MAERKRVEESDGRGVLIGLGIAGAAVIIAIAAFYWAHYAETGGELESLGQLGDALGPTASILNAVALFAAILSVYLQGKELRLQRKEMEENREVMREQAKHASAAARAQHRLTKATRAMALAQLETNDVARADQHRQILFRIMDHETRLVEMNIEEMEARRGSGTDSHRIRTNYETLRKKVTECRDALEVMRKSLLRKGKDADEAAGP